MKINIADSIILYAAQQPIFDEKLFNEYHALLVALGKNICKRRAPRCGECPLREMCPTAMTLSAKLAH